MTENNNIPKHWQIKKLGEVVSILGDGLHGTPRYSVNGDCFFINGNNLSNGKIIIKENTKRVSNDEYLKYKKPLNENTILVSINGTLGNVAFYKNEKVILGKSACYFNVLETIDKNYLKILLSGQQFSNYASNAATGSTIKNVSLKAMRDYEIFLPPLSEQQLIVSKIEELFSDLDNGKQQLLTTQQQLKVYRQSLLKAAFEGKLTAAWRESQKLKGNENLAMAAEPEATYKKNGELPEGWRIVAITDLAAKNKHAIKAGPFGSSLKKEFYVNDGYKIYGQEQVISGNAFLGDYYISNEKFEELESNKVQAFDVLISLVGTVGKVLILPENCKSGIINPRLIKISLNTEIYFPKFFKYYFESSDVKSLYGNKAQGTTMDVLNLGIIKTIPFPLPSLEEQQLIVNELESKLTVCDKMEETIAQSLQQGETLRQSILKKAFEGKLV